MIGTIRRHQQWLWGIIILAIIISFVVYFSPNSRSLLDSQGSYNFGSIKGRTITQEEYRAAHQEIELFYFLRSGKWPDRDDSQRNSFDIERETYNRIVLVEKLKELNVQPTIEATARWITEIFRSSEDQTFPMERYQAFVKNELAPRHLTSDDFYRFARHQVGQQHLISVFGLGGKLIAPQEAESFYRRLNEPLSTEAVYFSATNYLSAVSTTPQILGQFYTNNMARYRLPERVVVNYVKWEMTNFLADADKQMRAITNLSQRLDAVYAQTGGTNTYKDEKGIPLSVAAAKDKIKEDERKKIALISAKKQANTFLTELLQGHSETNPVTSPDLQKLAKAKNLVAKTTTPFDQRGGATDLKLPPLFVRAAFSAMPEDREQTILGEEGAYVITVQQKLPSEIQTFEKVQQEVEKDFRAEETFNLAQQKGTAFGQSVTNGIAQGKKFAEICAEAKIKPVVLPAFTLSTRSLPELGENTTLDQLQNVAASLTPGKASGFNPTATGGFVLFLKEKLPVDEALLKTEMPEFLIRQRDQRMSAAFNEWFQKLSQEMRLVPPPKSSGGKS
ncbi:MAG: SurA N-terminal domain-containing protein [Verrucomicrobiota bacterium]